MKKNKIIQTHHIIYENTEHKQKEITVKIYKGEHWISSQLQRRRYISRGFLKYLRHWIVIHEDEATNLNEVEKDAEVKQ